MSKKSAPDEPGDDIGAQLREMILGALDKAGGEEWLRRHGGDNLIHAYRRERRDEQK